MSLPAHICLDFYCVLCGGRLVGGMLIASPKPCQHLSVASETHPAFVNYFWYFDHFHFPFLTHSVQVLCTLWWIILVGGIIINCLPQCQHLSVSRCGLKHEHAVCVKYTRVTLTEDHLHQGSPWQDHPDQGQGSLLISKHEFFLRWYFQKLSFL